MAAVSAGDGSQANAANTIAPDFEVALEVRHLLERFGSRPVSAQELVRALRRGGTSRSADGPKRPAESARSRSGAGPPSGQLHAGFTKSAASKTGDSRKRTSRTAGGAEAGLKATGKVTAKKATARKSGPAKHTVKRRAVPR